MKHGNMSFRVSLFMFLLVATFAKGVHPLSTTTDGTRVPNSASSVMAYWQTVLPRSTMPSAIRDLLTSPSEAKEDTLNPAIFYSKEEKADNLNSAIFYGKKANEDTLNPAIFYEKEANGGNLNPAIIYAKEAKGEQLNPAIFYGNEAKGDNLNPAIFYGKEVKEDNLNSAIFYGKKANEDTLNPAIFYEKEANRGNLNPAIFYGNEAEGDNLNPAIFYEGNHHHVHGGHGHFNLRKIGFLEYVLKPGSKLAPYIHPASTPAPLLHRDAADSIPMTRKSFTAILRMFAPVSHSMAENIQSVLDLCEHPNPAKGEKKAYANSVESMVELAASMLASRDLRSFSSSPSVPAEGRNGSKAYKIASVTPITGKGDTMTCHGAPFPYKVFVCHALVPTRVYSVGLESDNDDEEKETMEALVVCHLNTSEFDPEKMPPHVKPGDAPVCHFLNRDDILWAPAATTLGTHGAIDVAAAL
ncbi:unnamed protein product [Urochloa decumbens]|uniref:BURP domain-containing protein n=1 Tax=Urochloa decumbens TaxID=240449 RepID=A0ABC9AII3_9POAL